MQKINALDSAILMIAIVTARNPIMLTVVILIGRDDCTLRFALIYSRTRSRNTWWFLGPKFNILKYIAKIEPNKYLFPKTFWFWGENFGPKKKDEFLKIMKYSVF